MSEKRSAHGLAGARRYLPAVLGAILLAAALPAPGSSGGLERVGTLPLTPGDAVVADAPTRRLIAIGGGLTELTLTAYDADRLTRLRSATLAPWWPQAGLGGRPRVYAVDAQRRRLYVLAYATEQEMDNTVNPQLLAIDLDALTVSHAFPLVPAVPPGFRVLGIRLRAAGRALLVTQAVPTVAVEGLFPIEAPRASGVVLVEIALGSGARTGRPIPVRGCQTLVTNQSQADVAVTLEHIYIGCATAQVLSFPVTFVSPGVPAVASVRIADPADQHLFFLPGSYATGDVYYDDVARRLLLVGSTAGRPAQAVWVFDVDHRVFVSQIAAGDVNVQGAGIDPSTGRLYVGIDGALLVTITRGLEVPQAARFDVDVNQGVIFAVPFNRSVIVPTRPKAGGWAFVVFRDQLPADAFLPGEPTDYGELDTLTTDAPQFSADAQAFGVRVHTIGGVNSALQNVLPLGGNYWRDVGDNTDLKDGDRDLYFSRIVRAHLSADEASAESVSADRDPNTESDYLTLSESAPLPPWPYHPADCRDFGGGAPPGAAERASAECRMAQGLTTAGTSNPGVEIPGLVSVAWSESSTTLRLDPGRGIVAEVSAEARDVVIADTVRIGSVRSTVVSRASGRRGGAAGDFIRTFENVVAGDYRCTNQCDASEVALAISDTLGSVVRVELPRAHELATRGGARGHALREPWEHQQDVSINNQDPTELQVPALRLVYINDSALASRVIVELAATKADATFLRLVPAAPDEAPPSPRVLTLRIAPPPPPVVPPPAPLPPPAPPVRHERRIPGHGWQVLLSGSTGEVLRSIALWTVFVTPLFLAARRRALRSLSRREP